MKTKKVKLLTTAALAFAVIAQEAQASKKGCLYFGGGYTGICLKVDELYCNNRITSALRYTMENMIEEVFSQSARDEGEIGFYWSRDLDGWRQRVIATQLLSLLAADEGK